MSLSLRALWSDEAGFIVSSELVLIATMVVIGLIVGLSEVQHSVVAELNDVADAVGSVNQSFQYAGLSSRKSNGCIKGSISGSHFVDQADDCDNNQCDLSCDRPTGEAPKGY